MRFDIQHFFITNTMFYIILWMRIERQSKIR